MNHLQSLFALSVNANNIHQCHTSHVLFLLNHSLTLSLLFSLPTEKLYNSTGRELRRALFSLKQIFQVIFPLMFFQIHEKSAHETQRLRLRLCFCYRFLFVMLSLQDLHIFVHVRARNAKVVHTYARTNAQTHTWMQHCGVFLFVFLLFSGSRVPPRRLCLRGSCSALRSSHTSRSGAGRAGLVGSWPSEGREKPQSDGKEQQTVTGAQNRLRIALRAP